MSTPDHVDLDALADVLAGEPVPDHLAGCPACRAYLEDLRVASDRVAGELAGLPPVQLPADLADRIEGRLRATPTSSGLTMLPSRSRSPRRWLPAAAAVVLLLAGAAYGVSRLSGGSTTSSTSASGDAAKAAAPAEVDVVRNSTGTDYTGRPSLVAAVPQLLAGSAASTAMAPMSGAQPKPQSQAQTQSQTRVADDPLARLRDNAGLAECLLALLPPNEPSVRPLAIDYASYKGSPAMVVVLPSSLPKKLDVFVVGPGCSRANDSTLFYASVDKP